MKLSRDDKQIWAGLLICTTIAVAVAIWAVFG